CVLTLNSEATVGHAIKSILKQRPPKDEVFFVVVDGGSRDRTIKIVNEVLRGLSYELISAPGSNIPQARNVCLNEAVKRGFERLIFIDSDIILLARNLLELAERVSDEHRDSIIHFSSRFLYFSNLSELEEFLRKAEYMEMFPEQIRLKRSLAIGMGFTIIPKSIFEKIRFDEDIDFSEDKYYALKAFSEGFEVLTATDTIGYVVDANIVRNAKSDIYWRMPFKRYLRAARKKAVVKYIDALDMRRLDVSKLEFLKRSLKFLLNTLLLIVMILTPVAYVSHSSTFYAFLTIDLLNMIFYPLLKRVRGYPFLMGVLNRFKFMAFSFLMIVWSYHAYKELKKSSIAFRRKSSTLRTAS
ncbi:MAG: glycosyltransferase, partial [Sulfolobales archaeon]